MPNDRVKEILKKAKRTGALSGFEMSLFMHNMLISKDGYVLDAGTYENVNAEVALRLAENIKKHPLAWKLFMVG